MASSESRKELVRARFAAAAERFAERERLRRLAPGPTFTIELGWYVLERRV